MLGSLLQSSGWPIALDIGTESIRMLQLQRVGQLMAVEACAQWHFPQSVGSDPAERRTAAVPAIRQMLRNDGFKGRRVVTALPCQQLQIKNVRLPQMPPHQLEQAVRREAAERFAFELVGNQLNYLNAGEIRSGNEVCNEIIMLAASPGAVEEHLAVLKETGLTPEFIEAQPVALFRVLERFLRRQADEKAVSVVADIGVSGTWVVVARGRGIVFMKRIDIGGRRMTEAVARQLNLEYEEAREFRRRAISYHSLEREQTSQDSPDPDAEEHESVQWTIRDAIRGEVEALARELALCLRYCSVTFRGLRPERIALAGGESCEPSFVEMLGELLNMECVVDHPLQGIDTSAVDLGEDRRAVLADWSLCMGLALRCVDLSQQSEEGGREEHRLSA